jgi:hypothetical protein
MEIKTKFNIRDLFYHIHYVTSARENCDVCDVTGNVYIKGNKYLCPKCHGRKYIMSETGYHWCIENMEPAEIEEIYIEISKHLKSPVVDYDARGFSGCCKEENMFLTIVEAQAECDKRNAGFGYGTTN